MDYFFLILLIFYSGAIIGSFLNVCVYRIPRHISIIFPGSFCPHCAQPVKWWNNIPIFSYLYLKGHCAFCRGRISWQYPMIEIGAGLMTIFLYRRFCDYPLFFFYLQFSYGLLAISWIDMKHRIIPNKILLFLLITGVIIIILYDIISIYTALYDLVISGFILYFIRTMGGYVLKKDALGLGDLKLGGVIGFYLGWYSFTLALLIGSFLAILVYIIKAFFASGAIDKRIPLAPYLSAGALITILYL